jgi:hypothetical protein
MPAVFHPGRAKIRSMGLGPCTKRHQIDGEEIRMDDQGGGELADRKVRYAVLAVKEKTMEKVTSRCVSTFFIGRCETGFITLDRKKTG